MTSPAFVPARSVCESGLLAPYYIPKFLAVIVGGGKALNVPDHPLLSSKHAKARELGASY